MSSLSSKTLAACAAALATALLCAAPAHAAPKHKSAVAAAKAAKSTEPKADPNNPDAAEPNVANSTAVEYQCELGNKLTIYTDKGDEGHIALRWKAKLHRLTKVLTSTGAHRYENPFFGLVWIGIPAKGMLLDSKHQHQLANECKSPEQATVATPPARQG